MTHWPDGFWWGTGASSTQCEGAAPASDWLRAERAGNVPVSGDGNGFAARYADDFARLAELGLTHHRLSVEWARIEPDEGRIDRAEVGRYRDILAAASEAGIAAWVCLHHFTLPTWFADAGGFLVEKNRAKYWTRHVETMAEAFGDLAWGWQPVNETNYYPLVGSRAFPPGWDRTERVRAGVAIHLATAEAAARLRQIGRPVASIFGLGTAVALDDAPETSAAVERHYAWHWDAGLGLFRDGVLRVPGADPVNRPDLAGCFDVIGFSYYMTIGFAGGERAVYPLDAPVSPLGYGIWADGLALVLDRLHAALPGTPLLVAEYGIGTHDDRQRAAYITDGLAATSSALGRGVDVRGFFHWTAVDNYEWLHGYDVSFGIIDRDRNVRPSARVLQAAALGS